MIPLNYRSGRLKEQDSGEWLREMSNSPVRATQNPLCSALLASKQTSSQAEPHRVGRSHWVVRVMWFKYWILPEAVLRSSHLQFRHGEIRQWVVLPGNQGTKYFQHKCQLRKAYTAMKHVSWTRLTGNNWKFPSDLILPSRGARQIINSVTPSAQKLIAF